MSFPPSNRRCCRSYWHYARQHWHVKCSFCVIPTLPAESYSAPACYIQNPGTSQRGLGSFLEKFHASAILVGGVRGALDKGGGVGEGAPPPPPACRGR